jgi:phospholipid transport system substrate-binding protein
MAEMSRTTGRPGTDRGRGGALRMVAIVASCAALFLMLAGLASAAVGGEEGGAKAQPQKKYYTDGSPTRAIQDLDDMLDDFRIAPKGGNLSATDEEHNRQIKQRIIHGTFDIRELSKQSLASHWTKRTPEEQDQFVKLLTDLLEEKALFSKEQSAARSKSGGKYFVVYRGHRFENKDNSRAFVRTKVVVPSENIDIILNYRLRKVDGSWKIYDVIVDEASLVDNYRYQFDSIIKKHGYADLVRRMSEKLAKIRADRQKGE